MTGAPATRSFSSPGLEHNLALADVLRPLAERHGTTVGTITIAWTLAPPVADSLSTPADFFALKTGPPPRP